MLSKSYLSHDDDFHQHFQDGLVLLPRFLQLFERLRPLIVIHTVKLLTESGRSVRITQVRDVWVSI